MPIYEYRCEKCGDFEKTQRITDPPLDRCPTCRRKVRRLISNTNFQLKGSGWYVTDYARSSNRGAEKSDAGSASDKSESKTETKADAKTETKTVSETKEKKKVANEK
jgi:putative FmdB family regulatory protein